MTSQPSGIDCATSRRLNLQEWGYYIWIASLFMLSSIVLVFSLRVRYFLKIIDLSKIETPNP